MPGEGIDFGVMIDPSLLEVCREVEVTALEV